MEIKIDAEQVNEYIKNAVLDSTVGKSIVASIDKEMQELFTGYRNPLKEYLQNTLTDYLKERFKDPEISKMINEAIIKNLTPEVVELIVNEGIYKLKKYWEESTRYRIFM